RTARRISSRLLRAGVGHLRRRGASRRYVRHGTWKQAPRRGPSSPCEWLAQEQRDSTPTGTARRTYVRYRRGTGEASRAWEKLRRIEHPTQALARPCRASRATSRTQNRLAECSELKHVG